MNNLKMTKLEKKVYKFLWKIFNSGYILEYNDNYLLATVKYIIEIIDKDRMLDKHNE